MTEKGHGDVEETYAYSWGPEKRAEAEADQLYPGCGRSPGSPQRTGPVQGGEGARGAARGTEASPPGALPAVPSEQGWPTGRPHHPEHRPGRPLLGLSFLVLFWTVVFTKGMHSFPVQL